MLKQKLLPNCTLKVRKLEFLFFIVPDYKLNTTVAEVANSIKKYQRMIHVIKDTLQLPHN